MGDEKIGVPCGRNGFEKSGENCRRFLKKSVDRTSGIWYSIVKGDNKFPGKKREVLDMCKKTLRDVMRETGGTVSWCSAYKIGDHVVAAVINGCEVAAVMIDNYEIVPNGQSTGGMHYTTGQLDYIAKLANRSYDLYKGYDPVHILLEAAKDQIPCRECPWFEVCYAMDEEV